MKGCRNRFVWTRPDSAGSGLKNSKPRSYSLGQAAMTSDSAGAFRVGFYPALKMLFTCLRSMPRLAADDRASGGPLWTGSVAAHGPSAARGWFGASRRTMRAGGRSVPQWGHGMSAKDGPKSGAWRLTCGCSSCPWRTKHESADWLRPIARDAMPARHVVSACGFARNCLISHWTLPEGYVRLRIVSPREEWGGAKGGYTA